MHSISTTIWCCMLVPPSSCDPPLPPPLSLSGQRLNSRTGGDECAAAARSLRVKVLFACEAAVQVRETRGGTERRDAEGCYLGFGGPLGDEMVRWRARKDRLKPSRSHRGRGAGAVGDPEDETIDPFAVCHNSSSPNRNQQ